jgi:hypothetical protein
MESSSRAALGGAWSPLGYQVVEISNTQSPPRPSSSPPRPTAIPPQPGGFQAVLVADETAPRATPPDDIFAMAPSCSLPKLEFPKTRRPRDISLKRTGVSPVLRGPLIAGGVILFGGIFMFVVASVREVHGARHQVVVNVPEVVEIPARHDVVLPEGLARKDDGKRKNAVPEPMAAAPDFPAIAGADEPKAGEPAGDCETFGTAVTFARNPQEAARKASAERKLTFLLHVSGNFEDAGFT